jgi:glutamine synthetase
MTAFASQLCPDYILREARQDGVEFLVGFESEFVLLESVSPVRVGSHHQYSEAKGFLASLRETKALEEMVDALLNSGIKVEACHPEGAAGQVSHFSVSIDFAPNSLCHTPCSMKLQRVPSILWQPPTL